MTLNGIDFTLDQQSVGNPGWSALNIGTLHYGYDLKNQGDHIEFDWRLAAERRIKETLLWVILFFFAPFNALMTGIGRLGYGVKIAATSRYQSVTAITLIAMIVLVLAALPKTASSRREILLRETWPSARFWPARGHRHRPVLCRQLYGAQ